MARKAEPANGEPQGDMFGFNTAIEGITINSPTIKSGNLTADLSAVTQAADAAFLSPKDWFPAVMRWAVRLCGGDLHALQREMTMAYREFWDKAAEAKARKLDEEIGFARIKDNDDENRRRSENLAERLFDILGIDLFPGEIDGWSDGQRSEVRSFLARVLQSREGGPWVDMATAPECLREALAREVDVSTSQQDATEIGEVAAADAETAADADAGGNVVALR